MNGECYFFNCNVIENNSFIYIFFYDFAVAWGSLEAVIHIVFHLIGSNTYMTYYASEGYPLHAPSKPHSTLIRRKPPDLKRRENQPTLVSNNSYPF